MKTLASIVFILIVGLLAWFFMKGSNQPDRVEVTGEEVVLTDGSYSLDTQTSVLSWSGAKPLVPGYFDNGTVSLKEGSFEVRDGVIASGTFVVDLTSIAVSSTGRGSGSDTLANHLKSADFFDVQNFPEAKFTITGATAAGEISGNLEIKGITQPVTFGANISEEDGVLKALSTIELDRTLWDIRYGSGKFFENLGNNLIADTFTVNLNLSANKNE